MRDKAILKRRSEILSRYPLMVDAAADLGMTPERLSRIVWGWVKPRPEEARRMAWKLQTTINELFPK